MCSPIISKTMNIFSQIKNDIFHYFTCILIPVNTFGKREAVEIVNARPLRITIACCRSKLNSFLVSENVVIFVKLLFDSVVSPATPIRFIELVFGTEDIVGGSGLFDDDSFVVIEFNNDRMPVLSVINK